MQPGQFAWKKLFMWPFCFNVRFEIDRKPTCMEKILWGIHCPMRKSYIKYYLRGREKSTLLMSCRSNLLCQLLCSLALASAGLGVACRKLKQTSKKSLLFQRQKLSSISTWDFEPIIDTRNPDRFFPVCNFLSLIIVVW